MSDLDTQLSQESLNLLDIPGRAPRRPSAKRARQEETAPVDEGIAPADSMQQDAVAAGDDQPDTNMQQSVAPLSSVHMTLS
jgi:hypothetical protein